MRIATGNAYDASLDSLMRRQTEMVNAQEQLTTGKRVNRASDDPAAAARAERALAAETRITAAQRGVDASLNAMTLAESAIGDATDLLHEVRDALVAAGNATYTDAERLGLAEKIRGLRDQLLGVANRTDGAGSHMFAGQDVTQAPFIDTPGGVSYRGGAGHLQASSGEALPLSVDGQRAWMGARTGNGVFETSAAVSTGTAWIDSGRVTDAALASNGSTYRIEFSVAAGTTTYSVLRDGAPVGTAQPFTAGQALEIDGRAVTITGAPAHGDAFEMAPSQPGLSVFDVLDRAVADLETPSRTGTQIAQSNAHNLTHVDAVMSQLQAMRSHVGDTLNRIDHVTGRLDAQKLSSKTARSDAEDLDMVHALSDFKNRQTGYDAALKSYSMVQKLSLFDYLG